MSICSPALALGSNGHFSSFPQAGTLSARSPHRLDGHKDVGYRRAGQAPRINVTAAPTVDISPRGSADRRVEASDGMAAEIVESTREARLDIRFQAPVHMLVAVEQGVRFSGETFVEGLPRSTLKDLRRKLTFVPADHAYHEWQEPSMLLRATYFYFDPALLPFALGSTQAGALGSPRLFFEDAALSETARKLRRVIEASDIRNSLYFEALCVILVHELARPHAEPAQPKAPARGGLAAWQQRILTDYIEGHLPEQISLARLSALVQLSPYHFCRAFKQSFGLPPHRYHTSRRIERAKTLLAKPDYSVTEIGMTVGFAETSSFTAAFRKVTGMTPTAYHRSLGA